MYHKKLYDKNFAKHLCYRSEISQKSANIFRVFIDHLSILRNRVLAAKCHSPSPLPPPFHIKSYKNAI